MLEIKRKTWDSDFFGFEVGEAHFDGIVKLDKNIKNKDNFKLIYLYSQNKILDFNYDFISTRVEFEREIQTTELLNVSKSIILAGPEELKSEKLKDLSLQSGAYSRFFCDKNFKNSEFEKLYYEWIKKSLINIKEIDTFLYLVNNEIAGFITLEKEKDVFTIGLLGVDRKNRGRGIGNALVEYCINESQKSKIGKLRVITQGENYPAMTLYKKNKFEIKNYIYIYHLWNI
ncbi:GNAT family N-acetyltransferase [Lacihabitans sp. LS3-19]|uniref:GNAT family N-acetyltransferase n=1 Tax=Lacihabitans sp. LS3-19 TaxID=2487335 RepID=UPI0020CC509F|nr:GNAT family N-acetyltransferase [Lacihabitans sp. LS3-19]MCP9767652.1 GNAT family N-acetyltransferase [Lacihabitans sp. LS3-19]